VKVLGDRYEGRSGRYHSEEYNMDFSPRSYVSVSVNYIWTVKVESFFLS
jgi:hypothetical protein